MLEQLNGIVKAILIHQHLLFGKGIRRKGNEFMWFLFHGFESLSMCNREKGLGTGDGRHLAPVTAVAWGGSPNKMVIVVWGSKHLDAVGSLNCSEASPEGDFSPLLSRCSEVLECFLVVGCSIVLSSTKSRRGSRVGCPPMDSHVVN